MVVVDPRGQGWEAFLAFPMVLCVWTAILLWYMRVWDHVGQRHDGAGYHTSKRVEADMVQSRVWLAIIVLSNVWQKRLDYRNKTVFRPRRVWQRLDHWFGKRCDLSYEDGSSHDALHSIQTEEQGNYDETKYQQENLCCWSVMSIETVIKPR